MEVKGMNQEIKDFEEMCAKERSVREMSDKLRGAFIRAEDALVAAMRANGET